MTSFSAEDCSGFFASAGGGLRFEEFETLLKYVKVVPIEEVDPNLEPFVRDLTPSWGQTLMRTLLFRYGQERCRYFKETSVAQQQYLVTLNPNWLDTLMLVSIDGNSRNSRIALVYKDWDCLVAETNVESRQFRISKVQEFFEDFVSCFACSIWSKLLS